MSSQNRIIELDSGCYAVQEQIKGCDFWSTIDTFSSLSDAEKFRVAFFSSPAINQPSDPYQIYLEVANSCADPWEKTSMRNNAARFKEALEKHAAAVKHSQEKI